MSCLALRTVVKISLLLVVTGLVSCKTTDDSSGAKAYEESTYFGETDRIYLAVNDYSIFKTPESRNHAEILKEVRKRASAPNRILNSKHLNDRVRKTARQSEMGMPLEGNFSIIGCFNEEKSHDECVALPNNFKDRVAIGQKFVKVRQQSKSDCRTKGRPGIRLNHRFRIADFPMLDVKNFDSIEKMRDSQRDGGCYELFSDDVIVDSMSNYNFVAEKLGPGFADYLRTGISGVGCLIGAGNVVNMIKAKNIPLAPGSLLFKVKSVVNSSRILGRIWGTSTKVLSAFGKIDDALVKLLARGKGSTHSPIVQKYLGVATAKIFSKLKGLGMIGAIGAVKISPRLTRLIGVNFFQANDDEFEPVNGKPVQYTVDQTAEGLDRYAADNSDVADNIDRVVNSDVYKSAVGTLEKYGFETKDLAYMALSVGAVFVPGLSCALLAVDINEVVDQKRRANNLLGLKRSIDSARTAAVSSLNGLNSKSFNELKELYQVYSEIYSAESVARQTRLGENRQGDYGKIGQYYRNLNYYVAKRFNQVVAKDTFKHPGFFGTTQAFKGLIDAEAKSKQRIDERFQALVLAKSAEIVILDQLKVLREEGNEYGDTTNNDMAVIYEETEEKDEVPEPAPDPVAPVTEPVAQ